MRGKIALKALEVINGQRQTVYGTPENNFEIISQSWKWWKDKGGMLDDLSKHDVAIMMALLKLARIKSGSGGADSYLDAIGYIALAADMKGFGKDIDENSIMKDFLLEALNE